MPPAAPHVLVIIQNLPFRIDRRVRSECRALTDAGYRVSVVCPQETPDEPARFQVDEVTVHSYAPPPPSRGAVGYVREFAVCWWRTARAAARVHRTAPFDVIQACNPPDTFWLLALLWRLRRGVRFVYDQHDLCPEVYLAKFGRRDLLYRALLLLERATYRTADHVISTNGSYQEIAQRRGRVDPARSSVVLSTPDADLMRRGDTEPGARDQAKHLVAYVGIMGAQDGVDRLLAAADHVVHERGRTDVRFALLGFGDALDDLRADCTRRGLDPFVTFTGKVDHAAIGRWLSSADLGVTPDPPSEFNDRSTMNKTLEYMAHELPVVASDLTETRRSAGEAARYVPGTDPAALGDAILEVLDDPERARAMGAVGRARIEGELSWRRQAATYVGVFDRLTGRTGERTTADAAPLG
ncbi:glycosyltransferase family 4 protein [Promicromonospora thailandica]|uniref:D-inositol 3-phosphate glycosyltransferase n=1 Tax=Promicromonospora thailandica TaxID=765201 RepID=A0A9X2G810_9MICO|nr:glycosyltransferase family 4 protein [Promicromonospora thailandica]MCP2264909.1 Glycosyltransferase involved in cell wall bisynthesis [Promicromonospora thailandica]BFF18822.1 glycosyltransferase family 4 protein [Promicromonospora thailandica]